MRGGNFSCLKEESQWAFRRFGDERDRHFSGNKWMMMVMVFLWVNMGTGEIIAHEARVLGPRKLWQIGREVGPLISGKSRFVKYHILARIGMDPSKI